MTRTCPKDRCWLAGRWWGRDGDWCVRRQGCWSAVTVDNPKGRVS